MCGFGRSRLSIQVSGCGNGMEVVRGCLFDLIASERQAVRTDGSNNFPNTDFSQFFSTPSKAKNPISFKESTLYPIPYTLYPIPYTLNQPYTLYPSRRDWGKSGKIRVRNKVAWSRHNDRQKFRLLTGQPDQGKADDAGNYFLLLLWCRLHKLSPITHHSSLIGTDSAD